MGKRGRKPSPDKQKGGYWLEKQEEAVLRYNATDDKEEKNKIYNEILKPALDKMIESIIRRYHLYVPEEEFTNTFNDARSFILTKANKYNPDSNKKAYSYYGTICKNYLIGRIQNYNKCLQRNPSYDMVSEEIIDNIRYSDANDKSSQIAKDIIDKLIIRIGDMLKEPECQTLKENERKLGEALKNLLEDWDFVLSTDCSPKLNKNAILLHLRETTGLNQKEIRDNLRKFKNEFLIIKDYIIK